MSLPNNVKLIDAKGDAIWDASEGRWVTFCSWHGIGVQHESRPTAKDWQSHPEEWCEGCQELAGRYEIVRFYRDEGHPRHKEIQASGLNLEQAKAHCKRPGTIAPDQSWFDGFQRET